MKEVKLVNKGLASHVREWEEQVKKVRLMRRTGMSGRNKEYTEKRILKLIICCERLFRFLVKIEPNISFL